jgi:hypothetical protein
MSNRLRRWFIIVDRVKKRKDLARPGTQTATWADAEFLRVDGDAAKDVMELATGFPSEAHMEDCL